jgi:uncharacterized protein YdcH (DUF465 family)
MKYGKQMKALRSERDRFSRLIKAGNLIDQEGAERELEVINTEIRELKKTRRSRG